MTIMQTNNSTRTESEMKEMWAWLVDTVGLPYPSSPGVWRYGRGLDRQGSSIVSHVADIEWIEFENNRDAVMFALRWT